MRYILIILLFTSVSFGQDYQRLELRDKIIGMDYTDTMKCNLTLKKCVNLPTWEKIMWMEIVTLAYGTVDYFAYNAMKDWSVEHYRFLQGLAFGGGNLFLNNKAGVSASAGFTLQVWGGVPDLYYYGIDKISGGFNGFSQGNEFAINKYYSHLNFMPTVIGQEKVHGLDLIVNVILTKTIAYILQYLNVGKL